MNQRIRDLAITGGIYDCICDPYDKLKNGDPYSSVMVDLERFAELIVKECVELRKDVPLKGLPSEEYEEGFWEGLRQYESMIAKHFGVEE